MKRATRLGVALCAAVAMSAGTVHAVPIDGTFNYQGRLTSAGAPITGQVDVRFTLWDAAAAGAQVGPTITTFNVTVVDGLFNQDLDFGVDAFDGEERWLEIEVRNPAGGGAFTTLTPRQQIHGTPYAIQTRGLFVDDALNVGMGTTSPLEDLHIDGPNPSLLLQDTEGGSFRSTRIDGDGFFHIETTHSFDGNRSGALIESGLGSQFQSFDREGGGFFGIVSAMGSSGINGDGFIELFSKETSGSTVILNADGNNNADDNEFGLLRLRSSGASGQGGTLSILNNSGAETIELLGGESGLPGEISLFDPLDGSQTVSIIGMEEDFFGTDHGGEIDIFSEDGFLQHTLEPDFDGEGAFMALRRNNLSNGLVFDGNFGGTGDPWMSIQGPARSATFNMNSVGSSSVSLPTNAIQGTEILDEPGVASATSGGSSLAAGLNVEASRTIICPTDGYCLVIASLESSASHVNGSNSHAWYGVSDVSTAHPSNQDAEHFIPSAAATGLYDIPVTVHGLFDVSAGSNTFYLLATESTGNFSTFDVQLTVVFFPTSYGTVTPTLMALPGQTDENTLRPGPMTAADIRAEQFEAQIFDQNRRDAEMIEYAERFAELEQRIRELEAQQGLNERAPRRATPPARLNEATGVLGHNGAGAK